MEEEGQGGRGQFSLEYPCLLGCFAGHPAHTICIWSKLVDPLLGFYRQLQGILHPFLLDATNSGAAQNFLTRPRPIVQ